MLKINNIYFNYHKNQKKSKFNILENFSFNVLNNEFLSIIGPSGCGKTTLINLIAGYLQIQEGEILENESKVQKPGKDRFVICQENDLFEWMTVYENIAFGLKEKKNIDYYIKLVHLTGFENKYPYELSGGMKKRVSLARAFSADAKYILMDEPFISLDYQIKESLYLELLKIWKETKKTIILITHDIEEAIYLSNRILVLSKRPATIKKIIHISFSQPRNEKIKNNREFINIKREILCLLDKPVRY